MLITFPAISWWNCSTFFLNRLESLARDTVLTRFVTSSGSMKKQAKPRAKPRVFIPNDKVKPGLFELSTYLIDGLSDRGVWNIGTINIEPLIDRLIPARCDLPTKEYEAHGLIAEFDNIPERHVNILNWTAESESQQSIALELVAAVDKQEGFHDNPAYENRAK